jgi:alkanesulfonate monooxygenase SsuD/methylene tetrahydromethanopterin reductase-like flavin-dependent oxidoreductase (luciferase family)
MKWGIFLLSQFPDQERRVVSFREELEQCVLAEQLGFTSVWIAEHLFSTYCVVSSAQVFAAAVSVLTQRIRIGTAVVVMPFNHPLRTAADFALVDTLSNGRLCLGVGRGYNPAEFAGLGLPIDKSRAMFSEGMDQLVQAWSGHPVQPGGDFWKVSASTTMLPRPVQRPHPPIYVAATSPDSFSLIAHRGWNLQIASTFSFRFFRENWLEALGGLLAGYETACVANATDPKAAERMLMIPFFVAETDAEAVDVHGPYVEWFLSKLGQVSGSSNAQPLVVPGYELSGTEGPKTVALGFLNYRKMHEHGAVIAGSPETCIARLRELRDALGVTEFCLCFDMGGIPFDTVCKSMQLAAERVFPYV